MMISMVLEGDIQIRYEYVKVNHRVLSLPYATLDWIHVLFHDFYEMVRTSKIK